MFGYTYHHATFPPNQTNGYFGKGSDGITIDLYPGGAIGGSGGGYYGGTCIQPNEIPSNIYYLAEGTGGSSYLSGFKGCDSVKQEPFGQIVHSGSPYHYSGFYFYDAIISSGLQTFHDPHGYEEKGHSGSGAIVVTYFGSCSLAVTCKPRYHPEYHLFVLIYLFCS